MTSTIGLRVRKWSSTLRGEIRARISSAGRRVDDWMSGAWEHVRDAVLSVVGWFYRATYCYRDRFERFEPLIIFGEVALISSALVIAYEQEISPLNLGASANWNWAFMHEHLVNWSHSQELGDICIFLLLFISGVSRLSIAARGYSLGYSYLSYVTPDMDEFYAHIRQAPWGSQPGGTTDADALSSYARTLASQSSSLLSLRTYHVSDTQWLTRDHESLLDWFTTFPAALWRLVPEDKSGESKPEASAAEIGGYYSVIVPTTAASAKHICRGQKATDLAEVDPRIAGAFGKQPVGVSVSNVVEFLAYLQLHVPQHRREQFTEEFLFAASIQHMVFLLHGIYGAAADFRAKWNFVIFLEAANSPHGRVMERLGFVGLEGRAHERSEEPTGPGKSYAGFPLFELKVLNGQPCPDPKNPKAAKSKPYAEKFVEFLEELTVAYGERTKGGAS